MYRKKILVYIYIYIYILKREKISLKIMTNRSKASSKSLSSSIVPNTSYMSSISVINTPTLVSILLQYPNCGSNFTPTVHKKVSASLSLAKGNFCPRLVPLHHLYIYIYIMYMDKYICKEKPMINDFNFSEKQK